MCCFKININIVSHSVGYDWMCSRLFDRDSINQMSLRHARVAADENKTSYPDKQEPLAASAMSKRSHDTLPVWTRAHTHTPHGEGLGGLGCTLIGWVTGTSVQIFGWPLQSSVSFCWWRRAAVQSLYVQPEFDGDSKSVYYHQERWRREQAVFQADTYETELWAADR